MANKSNKELIAEAQDLGREFGISVETDGLKNDGLVALVDGLRARRAAAPQGDAAQAEADAKAQAEADAKASEAPVYVIAKSPGGMRSVTSLRGNLVAGTVVEARDFHGGEETFRDLLKRGVVIAS
jgi:hypothetical protein